MSFQGLEKIRFPGSKARNFQCLERAGPSVGALEIPVAGKRRGSVLIVALWVIFVLSLLIGSLAFEMRVEANVAAFYRRRVKSQYLAQAGVEWTRAMLAKEVRKSQGDELILEDGDDEQMVLANINLSRGVGVSGIVKELGEGTFTVDVLPEEGRRNVNLLLEEDWKEIFDMTGVPQDQWDMLMDCFYDWIDPGDEHRLNGAEKDDPYYEERGYKVKNAPLDTVDELLLIKGFSEAIVFGGVPEDGGEPYAGIANLLTVWGDGRVNVNTATREVLFTLPGIDEWTIDDILAKRLGIDGVPGTKDDGFDSVDEVVAETGMDPALRERITTTDRKYLRVVSIGEVDGAKSGVWAILMAQDRTVQPVYWREEAME